MNKRVNLGIYKLMLDNNVRCWLVAKHLNIRPETLSRWLRIELLPEKKKLIINAIKLARKEE